MHIQLDDDQEPAPPKIALPLERLVFRNNSGQELLCISRTDDDYLSNTADMMFSHIAFGSLAVSALYTVVNLENGTIGLASKGDIAKESSDDFCTPPLKCISTMQTYYPPLNICEDPHCEEYVFMTLDAETRMCRWSHAVPICF